jgi:hypothetical protein
VKYNKYMLKPFYDYGSHAMTEVTSQRRITVGAQVNSRPVPVGSVNKVALGYNVPRAPRIKDAEIGAAALYNKLQSGCICTEVMTHDTHQVDKWTHKNCHITTD